MSITRRHIPKEHHMPVSPTRRRPSHVHSALTTLLSMVVLAMGPAISQAATSSISGHVYGGPGTGTPLSNVCVSAVIGSGGYPGEYPGYPGYGGDFVTVVTTLTNVNGGYTLRDLDPEQAYKVRINVCIGLGGYGFAPQFYDAVSDFGQAATLRPTAASPITGIDGHLPSLDAAPLTSITGGPAPDATTNQTSARFGFVADQLGATFECAVDSGSYASCSSPFLMNGLASGGHSFSVRARVNGKVDADPPSVSWTVDPSSTTSASHGTVTAGGTFSSDADAAPTAAVPVVAAVTLPSAGSVTLIKKPATVPNGNGYTVFGQQIDIATTAKGGAGEVTGSVANPIMVSFQIDASQIPAGTDPATVTVLRNGNPAADCASDDGTASPDPCIAKRRSLADGGLVIDVLTTHLSTWNFAVTSATTITPDDVPQPAGPGNPQPVSPPAAGGDGPGRGSVPRPPAKAPVLAFKPLRGLRLAGLLRSGLAVRLSCAEACQANVTLTVPAAVGRQLGLRTGKSKLPVTIGSASAKLTNKQKAVVVRLTAKARKSLRKFRRTVRVTVVVLARDADAATTSTRTVTVRR
jgi:hypothetical protein